MPRTKISKTSKRNREATNREEKIREFENSLDGFQFACDSTISIFITEYDNELKMLLQRTSSALLQTKICDLFEMVSDEGCHQVGSWKRLTPYFLLFILGLDEVF